MQFYPFGLKNTAPSLTTAPEILGGKGAGLVWMAEQGVPVPPGFIIPTTVWAEYEKKPKTTMKEIAKLLPEYLAKLKAHFGYLPLLSVRSGSRVSCPGMMDTILNVGIDEVSGKEWVKRLGPLCFGDSLHRLVIMYGSVVAGIRREELEPNLKIAFFEYERQTASKFPDAQQQLLGAIEAVFKSWDNDRAKDYRKINSIPREWGTAVTVQAMVFGNLNTNSGTGVLFTRNPNTGECKVTGEFLPEAQGEDIVAGIRTPMRLEDMALWNQHLHGELLTLATHLETLKKDVQDIEFTVQDGTLYLLQTRNAKRSAEAALRIAIDMVQSQLVDVKTAVSRVTIRQFDQAQATHLDPTFKKKAAFTGIAACNGFVTGKPVFTKEDAINCKVPCILVTTQTNPDDIAGIQAAVGVITMIGGFTSHAAVVARGFNRACIVGVGQSVDVFKEVDIVSLDGATGRIWMEEIPIIEGETNGLITEFTRMVFETLGAVPVITEVPTKPLAQALLYLGDQVLHTQAVVDTVLKTIQKVSALYLDLTPTPGSPDAEYLSMFETHNPTQRVLDGLAVMLKAEWKDRLTVVGGTGTHPFKIVATGSDLRSLVLADKELAVGVTLDTTEPAIAKVLAWKQAEGLQMVSMGSYVPDVKSIISVPVALHVALKGGQ